LPGVPDGAFVAKLTRPTLERMPGGKFATDTWVVFTPAEADDFANDKVARLLISTEGAFNATKERWTFGLATLRQDKVHILYYSHVAPRSEIRHRETVRVVGRLFGVFANGVLDRLGGK